VCVCVREGESEKRTKGVREGVREGGSEGGRERGQLKSE
jgi:hypothetical protein